MNNKITILSLLIVLIIGCTEENPLSFSSESFTEESLPMCKNGDCAKVTINYATVSGRDAVSDKINTEITALIIASLQLSQDEPVEATSISEATQLFIERYQADKAEFPDMAGEYEAQIQINKLYNNEKIVSFEAKNYQYAGGAHGYSSTIFLNFDAETGEVLETIDLVNDLSVFKAFAEKEFRKSQKISQNDAINSTGFWFEDEVYHLPESIGITKDELLFVYNQYDIASYSDGPIEFKIPMGEASEYLKF